MEAEEGIPQSSGKITSAREAGCPSLALRVDALILTDDEAKRKDPISSSSSH
jgi:hypothetical protein